MMGILIRTAGGEVVSEKSKEQAMIWVVDEKKDHKIVQAMKNSDKMVCGIESI
eukprot:CAMPEP_0170551142 /NCGR_PEP_ID=MMETSP0211-20121228/9175_1 /TAXON_ID=311385 /ORGANISM="Pseudokeronopsis sp., Strain OXSARD2" /LENGTH=52 /DNA_ID=CAMNT_0010858129 /DNA_START=211 /DNA_END=366 /DNA_ORIENTATION=+